MAEATKKVPASDVPLQPRVKLWIEKDGHLVLSQYRVALLRHIAETGSLAQAAQRIGWSYRRAWGKIKEIERNLGAPLVHSTAGGQGGGHTSLTPLGERLVDLFDQLQSLVEQDVIKDFERSFHTNA